MFSRITTNRYYLFFSTLIFVILLADLGSYGLAETSEARYAEISREMLYSGDYLNPELLGIFHFHKPPMAYYITTLGYRIFGITEFGARFFLQVAIVLQLLLVYGITNLLYKNRKIAYMSALVYFAMPIVLISSRNLTADAYLTTFILGSIYCWQYYTSIGQLTYLYLFYWMVALALLTKGPVALLFILTYIIVYKLIFKCSSKINLHHLLGFVLCLVIGSSWYIMVVKGNPGLWGYFIEKQLLSRMAFKSFNRAKPFWFYIPIIFALVLPWWGLILHIFKKKGKRVTIIGRENKLLLISSVFLVLIFSVFKTKLIMYILPVVWMLSILIAVQLFKITPAIRYILNVSYALLTGLLFLGVLIIWFLQPAFLQISSSTLVICSVCVAVFGGIYFLIDNGYVAKPAILGASFGAFLILMSTSIMSNNGSTFNSTKEMIGYINAITPKGPKTIVVYDYLLSSIPVYSGANPITIKFRHNTTDREVQFQRNNQWQANLWDINDKVMVSKLDSLSHCPNTYLIIRRKIGFKDDLKFLLPHFSNRHEYPKWLILYNK